MPKQYKKNTTKSDLTKRELEVLKRTTQGISSLEIGQVLNVSQNTIEAHRKSILKKLVAKNMVEAIATAFRDGLIQ